MYPKGERIMYLEKAFVVILWLIFAMALLGGGYTLLNVANTFANLGGVLLILVTIYVTIKTKCLTTLFKNKNEKN